MYVLNSLGPGIEARVYWARGGPSALQEAVSTGALTEAMAARIAREMPLLALEDVVGLVGFERFEDAASEPLVTETQLAVLEGKSDLVWSRQELLERWMQLRWVVHGHHAMVPSDALARAARDTELQGYCCDDVTVRGRTLHVSVPPIAGVTLPDARGRDWLVADMLISSEGDGQQWRVLLEAPSDTPQQQAVAGLRIDWPAGTSVHEALDRFVREAAPGVDWRGAWRWILGVLLAHQPPPARA